MLFSIEGNFSVIREVAEWCFSNDIEAIFIVRCVDRIINDHDNLTDIYTRYVSVADAARGDIKHEVSELSQTRIIGPVLIDLVGEIELFTLRYRGVYGIDVYQEP